MGVKSPGSSSPSPSLVSASNPPSIPCSDHANLGFEVGSKGQPSSLAANGELEPDRLLPHLGEGAYPEDQRLDPQAQWTRVQNRKKGRFRAAPSSVPPLEQCSNDCHPPVRQIAQEKGTRSRMPDRSRSISKPMSFTSTPCSWASIVTGVAREVDERRLQFVQPSLQDGNPVATISKAERSLSSNRWGNTLLFYVVGQRPHFHHLRAFILRKWQPSEKWELFSRDNGFFLAKFTVESDCNRVLEGGPWMYDGRLMIVKKWTAQLRMDRDLLKSLPLWVRMPGLNLSLWNPLSISKIASVVGVPLYMDAPTASMERISFARVLVEVSAASPLPKSVNIMLEDGEFLSQEIVYEWTPPLCLKCKFFGHLASQCTVALNHIWVPVQSSSAASLPPSDPMLLERSAPPPSAGTDAILPMEGGVANNVGGSVSCVTHSSDLEPMPVESPVLCPPVLDVGDPPRAQSLVDTSMLENSSFQAEDFPPLPVVTKPVATSVGSSSVNVQGPTVKVPVGLQPVKGLQPGHVQVFPTDKPTASNNRQAGITSPTAKSESWAKKGFLSKGLGGSSKVTNTTIFEELDALDSDDDEYVEEDEDMRSDSEDHHCSSESTYSYANPKWEEVIGALMKGKEKKSTGRKPKNNSTGAQKGFNVALRSTKKN